MTEPMRVLHVDDDRDFLATATAFLERENDAIETVTATTADEGLEILADGSEAADSMAADSTADGSEAADSMADGSEATDSTAADSMAADSTADGSEAADGQSVECVVSDYQMPGADGLQFLESVREAYPDLPFVLFTGKGSEEIASEAISAGVTDYLQKGTGTDQFAVLANRVENAVEHYRAERALRESEDRYRTLVEQSHDAIYIYSGDGLLYVNDRGCELSGYSERELKEMDVAELVHPEDREWLFSLGNVHESSTDFEGTHQLRILTADDEVRHVEFYAQPIVFEGDRAVLGSVRDVTDRKRAEERFTALIEASSDVLTLLSADGTVLYQSPAIDDVLGYDPSELLGQNGFDYVHPDDRERVAGQFARVLEDPEYRPTVAYRFRHADGSWRVLESRGSNRLNDPAIEGVLLNSRDVTERRERAQELERYETVMDAVGDPVYAADAEGRFTFVNDAMERLSGYDADELLGEHISTVTPDEAVERGRAVVEGLVTGESDNATFEMTAETADGERVPCEIHMAVLPHDETFRGTAGVVRSIADRRRMERQLRSERDRFATLFENVPDPAVEYELVDGAPVVRSVNAAFERMFGYDVDAIAGEDLDDFIVDADRRAEARELNEQVAAGERLDVEVRRRTADGLRDFMLRNVPLEGADAPTGYAIYTDITERKRHERELKWQNERLEEFASVVSHDLRNPLNVARGALELYDQTGDADHLGKVERAHDRIERIVEDVLSLARQGQAVDEPERVALDETVSEAWQSVETGAAELVVECDGSKRVLADPPRLLQLLENVFRNAVEHGGSEVTVRAGDLEGGFYVADDGPGIPADEREAVFDSGYTTSDEGLGFGLAIVKRIAEAHGWTVDLEGSEAGGARFEVTGLETAGE